MFRKLLSQFTSPAKTGLLGSSSAKPKAFASSLLTAALVAIAGTALCSTAYAIAPVAVFTGFQRTLPITLSGPSGVAVDSNGNIYVADQTANAVYKETPLVAGGYTQTTVASVTTPASVAVDNSGNVYITTGTDGHVYKETLASGAYTQSTVTSGLLNGWGVAVDTNGNVYVADNGSAVVYKESLSGGVYTQSSIGSGISFPSGVAVDSLGNVYVADQTGSIAKLAAGTYARTTISTSYSDPTGIAVDGQGNVYVTDGNGGGQDAEFKLTPTAGSGYVASQIASNLTVPYQVAVDSQGNVYIADTGAHAILEISNNFGAVNVLSANTGNSQITANFSFGGSGGGIGLAHGHQKANYHPNIGPGFTLGGVVVTTQGITGLDFTNAGTGTCVIGTAYTSGQSCSVNIAFAPTAPGLRMGSVELTDGTGNLQAEGNFQGIGIAPQADFLPGTVTSVSGPIPGSGIAPGKFAKNLKVPALKSGLHPALTGGVTYPGDVPAGIVVDAAGNLYVADPDFCAIYMSTASSNGQVWNNILAGSPGCPLALAIDGSGNIFFTADTGGVYELILTNGQYVENPLFPSPLMTGIAVDANENIYLSSPSSTSSFSGIGATFIAPHSNIDPSVPYPTIGTISNDLQSPWGITVDASGNVFVTDYKGGAVYKETPASDGTYTETPVVRGLDAPTSVSVDPSGNLYIVDLGVDNQLSTLYLAYPQGAGNSNLSAFENSDGYSLFPITTSIAVNDYIWSAAIAGNGNIYMTDLGLLRNGGSGNNAYINELDIADPPSLQFAPTVAGNISSDSPQDPILFNTGNSPLVLEVPTTGTNASISSNFLLNSTGSVLYPGTFFSINDCTLVTPSSASASLFPDSGCSLPVSFAPQSFGSVTGTLVITDNSLNQVASNGDLKHADLKARPEIVSTTFATQTINLTGNGSDVFNIAPTGAIYALIAPGASATYTFTISPISPATTFPQAITLTATGGPLGSTYVFSQPTIAAGAGTTTVTLTVTVPVTTVVQNVTPSQPGSKFPAPLALALLFLPLAAKMRKAGKRFSRMVAVLLLLVAGITATVGLSGCYSKLIPATYVITAQGQSGSVIHTAAVSLSVK